MSPSIVIPADERSPASCWILSMPLLAVVIWSAAFFGYLDSPSYAEVMVCMLMPLCCLSQVARVWGSDPALSRQVILYLAGFAWTAVCIVLHPGRLAVELGWLGIELAGLATFLAVATSATTAARGFLVAGTAAVCAMAVALTGTIVTHSVAFGLGNINYLLCSCDPALFALTAWTTSRWWGRERVGTMPMLMPLIGLSLLMVEIVYYHYLRRGSLLAGAAALMAVLAPMVYRRLPRLTMLAGVLALSGVVLLLVRVMAQPLPSFRFDRIYLYGSVLQRFAETWATGGGPYASLSIQDCQGEIARHWIAVGHWTDHAHNELLEALLGGGVVSGGLWIAAFTALVLRVRHISDPSERRAASALLAALFVHAMTDNSYSISGLRLMMYGMLGLIFLCRAREAPPGRRPAFSWAESLRSRLPSPRQIALVGACAGAAVAYREVPGALLVLHAPPAAHIRSMTWSIIPSDTLGEFPTAFNPLLQDGQLAQCKKVLDIASSHLGMMGPMVAAQQQLASARLGYVESSPQRWGAQSEEAHRVEIDDSVRADIQFLGSFGFCYACYLHLGDVLARHPEVRSLVDDAVLRRIGYISGAPMPLPSLQPSAVHDMDAAIDRYAELCWWIQQEHALPQAREALLFLVGHYGDVSEVSAVGMSMIARAQPDPVLDDQLRPALALGVVIYSTPFVQAAEIAQRASEAALAGNLPEFSAFIASLYPSFWQEFVRGTAAGDEEDLDVRAVCMQLFGQARRVSHGSPP